MAIVSGGLRDNEISVYAHDAINQTYVDAMAKRRKSPRVVLEAQPTTQLEFLECVALRKHHAAAAARTVSVLAVVISNAAVIAAAAAADAAPVAAAAVADGLASLW